MPMSEKIDRATFDHLVELAALELDDTQAEYLRRELNKQLEAIAELSAIPIPSDTEVSLHGVDYPQNVSPPPREDVWIASGNADDILSQAPQTEGRFLVVPDIPHTSLDNSDEEQEDA
ncbi:MAG TPA: aspartyl/glutamyl-tRNA amidotransferase subunit C [Chloroflexi bacterium]|nr:aspartyl/glutamyl-tRNA amidotransferase subunit C [Chloroflexota bacterium]